MGFLEEAEKIAGAVVAVEGVKKVDPKRIDFDRRRGRDRRFRRRGRHC